MRHKRVKLKLTGVLFQFFIKDEIIVFSSKYLFISPALEEGVDQKEDRRD
jgi:hypothetical protein